MELHGSRPTPERAPVRFCGDFVFLPGYDIMSATTKAQQGLHEALATEEVFVGLPDQVPYRQERIFP